MPHENWQYFGDGSKQFLGYGFHESDTDLVEEELYENPTYAVASVPVMVSADETMHQPEDVQVYVPDESVHYPEVTDTSVVVTPASGYVGPLGDPDSGLPFGSTELEYDEEALAEHDEVREQNLDDHFGHPTNLHIPGTSWHIQVPGMTDFEYERSVAGGITADLGINDMLVMMKDMMPMMMMMSMMQMMPRGRN